MYSPPSVFPALAAVASLYRMFATSRDVINQIVAGVLSPGVRAIFNTELQAITKTGQGTLPVAQYWVSSVPSSHSY
jgi:hypothetical protein